MFVIITSFLIFNFFYPWFSSSQNGELKTNKNISTIITFEGTIFSNNTVIEDTMKGNPLYFNQTDKISFFILAILIVLGLLLVILVRKYAQLIGMNQDFELDKIKTKTNSMDELAKKIGETKKSLENQSSTLAKFIEQYNKLSERFDKSPLNGLDLLQKEVEDLRKDFAERQQETNTHLKEALDAIINQCKKEFDDLIKSEDSINLKDVYQKIEQVTKEQQDIINKLNKH